MPSQLVDDVRGLIHRRADDGRPLTMPERALLLGTILPMRGPDVDVVDALDQAIAQARRVLLDRDAGLDAERRAAVRDLLSASRAVLDHTPASDTAPAITDRGRPFRADVDG